MKYKTHGYLWFRTRKTSMIKLRISFQRLARMSLVFRLFFRAQARFVILKDEIKQRMRDGYYARESYPGAYKCSISSYILPRARNGR